jgi:cytochrome c peroxidase
MSLRCIWCFIVSTCVAAACCLAGCNTQNTTGSGGQSSIGAKSVEEGPRTPGDGTAAVAANADAATAKPSDEEPAENGTAAEGATAEEPAEAGTPTAAPAEAGTPTGPIILGTGDLLTGIPGEGPLTTAEIQAWLDDPRNHEPLDFVLPLGLNTAVPDQIKGVAENPLTRAKIELGRQLYFDPRLSADKQVSCASCHHPDEGFSKHTQFGVGIAGQQGGRNSPVSYNRILSDLQFWDGRAGSLEEQALGPIQNPIEMGNTRDGCIECLAGVEGYRMQFEKVFGEPLNIQNVGKAIAAFERAIVAGPSPFDYGEQLRPFVDLDLEELKEDDPDAYALYEEAQAAADANTMSDSARRGRELFFGQKAGCTACHVGPNLSDEKYHNIGVGMAAEMPDLGRFVVTNDEKDKGAFKTPTIRNVALSAPYMHDGSQKTLEEVVEWYAKGGHPNPYLSEKIKKLDLTDQDKKDLVEFMKACTGEFPQIETGRLPE